MDDLMCSCSYIFLSCNKPSYLWNTFTSLILLFVLIQLVLGNKPRIQLFWNAKKKNVTSSKLEIYGWLAIIIAFLKNKEWLFFLLVCFAVWYCMHRAFIDSEHPYCNVLVSEGWHCMLNIAHPLSLLSCWL
jgi:hypothetical protein